MKNIRTFDQYINEKLETEQFEAIFESATDVYRRLVGANKTLMRSLFNIAKSANYSLDNNMNYEEISPKAALKLRDEKFLKFWLDNNDQVIVVTLGNFILDGSFRTTKKLNNTELRYFYTSYMFGNDETYKFIKGGGYKPAKFKAYLADKSATVINVDIGYMERNPIDENAAEATIKKYAEAYKINIVQGDDRETIDKIIASSEPVFIKNPGGMSSSSKYNSYEQIPTGEPAESIDKQVIINLFREFAKRIPLTRGASTNTNVSRVRMNTSGGVTDFEFEIKFPDTYSKNQVKLLPNPALINSIIQKFGIEPIESYYCDYFVTLKFATSASKKAAKMSSANPHEALFNGHKNDCYNKALAIASPKIKRHAAKIGDQVMLLWNDGDLKDPEYIQFFTDLVMFYTNAEDLPGDQGDVFGNDMVQEIIVH